MVKTEPVDESENEERSVGVSREIYLSERVDEIVGFRTRMRFFDNQPEKRTTRYPHRVDKIKASSVLLVFFVKFGEERRAWWTAEEFQESAWKEHNTALLREYASRHARADGFSSLLRFLNRQNDKTREENRASEHANVSNGELNSGQSRSSKQHRFAAVTHSDDLSGKVKNKKCVNGADSNGNRSSNSSGTVPAEDSNDGRATEKNKREGGADKEKERRAKENNAATVSSAAVLSSRSKDLTEKNKNSRGENAEADSSAAAVGITIKQEEPDPDATEKEASNNQEGHEKEKGKAKSRDVAEIEESATLRIIIEELRKQVADLQRQTQKDQQEKGLLEDTVRDLKKEVNVLKQAMKTSVKSMLTALGEEANASEVLEAGQGPDADAVEAEDTGRRVTPGTRHAMVACDECGLKVKASNMAGHKLTHIDKDDPRRTDMVKCDVCGTSVSKKNIKAHDRKCQNGSNKRRMMVPTASSPEVAEKEVTVAAKKKRLDDDSNPAEFRLVESTDVEDVMRQNENETERMETAPIVQSSLARRRTQDDEQEAVHNIALVATNDEEHGKVTNISTINEVSANSARDTDAHCYVETCKTTAPPAWIRDMIKADLIRADEADDGDDDESIFGLASHLIFHPTFNGPLPADHKKYIIFRDPNGNYGAAQRDLRRAHTSDDPEVTLLTPAADSKLLKYLASFISDNKAAARVRTLTSQTTVDKSEQFPLLLLLLRAFTDGEDLRSIKFELPLSRLSREKDLLDEYDNKQQTVATGKKHSDVGFGRLCRCLRPVAKNLTITEEKKLGCVTHVPRCHCGPRFAACSRWMKTYSSSRTGFLCRSCAHSDPSMPAVPPLPGWGGEGMTMTCPLDGFLAMLIIEQDKNPKFISILTTNTPFTNACRVFLSMQDESMKERKRTLVEALFSEYRGEDGNIDLFAGETALILERSKREATLIMKSLCGHKCEDIQKNSFVVTTICGNWEETLRTTMAPKLSEHRCEGSACKDPEYSAHATPGTWLLPFDLSQFPGMTATELAQFPRLIKVGRASFVLGGLSIFTRDPSGRHFGMLLRQRDDFLLYDGLSSTSPATVTLDSIDEKWKPSIAYYVRN